MANQVLSRPMFKPSPNQVAPTVSGIGAMTTPDQNAQALKNMFAPQPAYKRGGEVINGVAHFAEGDEVVAPPAQAPAPQTSSRAYEDFFGGPASVASTIAETRRTYGERAKDAPQKPGIVDYFRLPSGEYDERKRKSEEYAAETMRKVQEDKRLRDAGQSVLRGQQVPSGTYDEITNPYMTPGELSGLDKSVGAMPPAQVEAIRSGKPYNPPASSPPPPPPPDPVKESIQTNLQAIKERREASDKQREENKNLALLSAGLGMMAGTNRNAFANIGAGGQQGIATFAGLEKARREDDASRRQEQYQQQQLGLQNRQLAQQRELTMAQIEKDPDTIRLYRALGSGDLMKGYQLVSSDATLKAAQTLAADITAPETERATARAFLNSRISEAMGSRTGSTQGFDPSKFSVKTVR